MGRRMENNLLRAQFLGYAAAFMTTSARELRKFRVTACRVDINESAVQRGYPAAAFVPFAQEIEFFCIAIGRRKKKLQWFKE